jgi:hypothetical protein
MIDDGIALSRGTVVLRAVGSLKNSRLDMRRKLRIPSFGYPGLLVKTCPQYRAT